MEKAEFYPLFLYAKVKPRWVVIYFFIKCGRFDFILKGPNRLGEYFITPFGLKHPSRNSLILDTIGPQRKSLIKI